jgi:hypothetical protein
LARRFRCFLGSDGMHHGNRRIQHQ